MEFELAQFEAHLFSFGTLRGQLIARLAKKSLHRRPRTPFAIFRGNDLLALKTPKVPLRERADMFFSRFLKSH